MANTLTPARRETSPGDGAGEGRPVRGWRRAAAAGTAVLALAGGAAAGVATEGFGAFSRRPPAAGTLDGEGGNTDNAPVAPTGPERIESTVEQNAELRQTLEAFLGGEITDENVVSEEIPEGSNAAMTTITADNGSKLYVAADAHEVGGEAGVGRTRAQMEEAVTTDPDAARRWKFSKLGDGAGAWYNVELGFVAQVNGYTGAGTNAERPFFIQAELVDVPGDPNELLAPLAGVTAALNSTGVFK